MTRCVLCDDRTPDDELIDGLCLECADLADALPAEPPTIAEQFRTLDHLKAVYGVDVGDPHRDWSDPEG